MLKLTRDRDFAMLFDMLLFEGKEYAPRGQKTIEVENFTYQLEPGVRYNKFAARKLNMNYIKRELAWYINADPYDLSIAEYAKAWGPMISKTNKINSCYGDYWFRRKTGVNAIVRILKEDPMSRRAVIPMYGTEPDHHDLDVRDVPCTTNVEFRLRNGQLNARFVMRSQDAVLGMGNDVPAFSFLQEVVARLVDAEVGTLTISVGSFHVYERHYEMAEKIGSRDDHLLSVDEMPPLTKADAELIAQCKIPETGAFAEWLKINEVE